MPQRHLTPGTVLIAPLGTASFMQSRAVIITEIGKSVDVYVESGRAAAKTHEAKSARKKRSAAEGASARLIRHARSS